MQRVHCASSWVHHVLGMGSQDLKRHQNLKNHGKGEKVGRVENQFLYHGSHKQGLRTLEPNEAGYGKAYVFASDNIAAAKIFLGRGRNSFEASWSMGGQDQYFCERKVGIFDKWYSGVSGSVYALHPSDFKKDEAVGEHEYVSSRPVRVIEEVSQSS